MSPGESKPYPNSLLKQLFNYGVSNVQPRNILRKFLSVDEQNLVIKDNGNIKIYKDFKKIIPICIGKASVDMGNSALSILKDLEEKISKGIIIVNKENFRELDGFKCFYSGHPIPDENGLIAAQFLEKKLKALDEKDLVLLFLSGGGSSLVPYPVSNIQLNEKVQLNHSLLNSGADIREINTVRKHLSKIKGGNLLKMIFPAKVHSFILSDVIGDDLSSISSGPTVPDPSTFKDVIEILKKYSLWDKAPSSVKSYIELGLISPELETPDQENIIFSNSDNTLIGSNNLCLKSILNFCRSKKIESKIWKNNLEGDVEILAKKFSDDIRDYKNSKSLILISGGESTVKIKGKGKGGRNQEFALHFLKNIKKSIPDLKFTMLSAGTDGRDGPTDAAGAIINHNTLNIINDKKIDLEKELNNNNSYEVLKKIDSLVIIDGTNTNVADLQLIMIN